MAQQTINIGASPNDGTGTPLRTAFQYTNSNFSELYTAVGPSGNNIVVPGSATITGDLTVDVNVLKVDSSGNRVSVNTTTFATDSAFAVKTTAGKFDVRAAGSLSVKLNSDQSMLYNVPTGNSHLFQINDSDAMTLNATGLGVGGSPLVKLSVVDTVNTFAASFRGNLGTDIVAIGTTALGASINAYTAGFGAATNLVLQPNGGNVGIGVTPSAWGIYKGLQVGYASLAGYAGSDTFLGSNVYFDGGAFKYIAAGLASSYRQLAGGHQWSTAVAGANPGDPLTLLPQMTLDASGNLSLANGNLVMGTSGKGIDFSATPNSGGTMTSELLNDYEEGDWTIGLTFGGASTSMTTNANTGKYTKIGRQVTVTGYLALTNKGSATGDALITGLPFLINSYGGLSIYLNAITFADFPMGYSNNGTSTIPLRECTNAGVTSSLTDSDFANNSEIIFTMTYNVA